MRKLLIVALVMPAMFGAVNGVRAADDATAIIDKAIAAVGGEAKLKAAKGATWKTKGKIIFGDNESEFTGSATSSGLDHFRQDFEGDFGGNKVQGVTVLAGDKGWRKFGENSLDMDAQAVANEKRTVLLQIVPALLVPLKSNDFKLEAAGQEKVGDAEAVGVKATGPDGKDFTIYFDKTSGLPVKLLAKVVGFGGEEFTQETLYSQYKEFAGVKKATKVEAKRDGQRFLESETTEFKLLDKVDDATFAEPK